MFAHGLCLGVDRPLGTRSSVGIVRSRTKGGASKTVKAPQCLLRCSPIRKQGLPAVVERKWPGDGQSGVIDPFRKPSITAFLGLDDAFSGLSGLSGLTGSELLASRVANTLAAVRAMGIRQTRPHTQGANWRTRIFRLAGSSDPGWCAGP